MPASCRCPRTHSNQVLYLVPPWRLEERPGGGHAGITCTTILSAIGMTRDRTQLTRESCWMNPVATSSTVVPHDLPAASTNAVTGGAGPAQPVQVSAPASAAPVSTPKLDLRMKVRAAFHFRVNRHLSLHPLSPNPSGVRADIQVEHAVILKIVTNIARRGKRLGMAFTPVPRP